MATSSFSPSVEHFCTLFDRNYLPLGMTLHTSLMAHAQPFHLWILCMDEEVEQQLFQLSLPHVTLIPLGQVETPELRAVKLGRSRGEYCWTLTPFSFEAVFQRDASVEQVTYLDADLYFFANPRQLLQEFPRDRHVLLTDHAYAPEYDQSAISGRFCVQFLTFRRTDQGFQVMKWWQDRCLEWCFNRVEDGKFGDQKYLDLWIELFPDFVYVVEAVEKTLAPWNVTYFQETKGSLSPVFYHFHGFKLIATDRAQIYLKYHIAPQGMQLYQRYIQAVQFNLQRLHQMNIPVTYFALNHGLIATLRRWKWQLFRETRFSDL